MAWHKPTNVNEWVTLVLRHKGKFLLPGLAAMTLVIWISHYYPRQFLAEARFRRLSDPAVTQMGSTTASTNLATVRREMEHDVRGRPALEQLIRDLGLMEGLPHSPEGQLTAEGQLALYDLVRRMQEKLDIRAVVQSDTVDMYQVTYVDDDPTEAARIVDRVVDNYVAATQARLKGMLQDAMTFFQRELARAKVTADELSAKKVRFEMDYPGLAPDDPGNVRTRLVEVRARLDVLQTEVQKAIGERSKMQEYIQNAPEMIEEKTTGVNPEAALLMQRMSTLQAQLDDMRARGYKEEHPSVKKLNKLLEDLRGQLAKLEKEVDTGTTKTPNLQRLQVQADVERLSGAIQAGEKQRDELMAEVERLELMNRNFFGYRSQYLTLVRESEDAAAQVKFWDENLRKTSSAYAVEVSARGTMRLTVLDRANKYARPVKPVLGMILGIAVLAGLAVGALMVFLAELFDGSFHSVEQATDGLKLPVLGAVSEITTPVAAFRQRLLTWGVYPSTVLLLLLAFGAVTYTSYLSLHRPDRYQLLTQHPRQFLKQTFLGGS